MTSAGVADASADITEAGYVVLSSSGTFTVTWTDTVLRNVLGFTADLSAASSYVATYKSELFWSPGYVATRPMPNSVGGVDMNDTRIQISRDGTQRNVVSHHTRRFDTLSWDAVWHERVWYADSAQDNAKGGTWRRFRERVWALGRTFDVYLVVDETAGSTTTATWPSALGRYLCRELPPGDPPRKHQQMQTLWNLSVETHEWS